MCEEPHEWLSGALRADAHRPVLLLVEGPAWTGKSHLVRELLDGAAGWSGSSAMLRFASSGELLVQPSPGASLPPPPGLALSHLVVTYRPEELPVAGLVWSRAAHYPEHLVVRRRRLEPMDIGRTQRLVNEQVGAEQCAPGFVERLAGASGGIPQVLHDVLRELPVTANAQRRLAPEDVDNVAPPARLAELVLGRIANLDARYRPLVWAAAVLDEPATTHELTRVAGLRPEHGAAALAAAVRLSVLAEQGDNRYGFPVPLAASAVLQHVPGPVQETVRARLATAPTAPTAPRGSAEGTQGKEFDRGVDSLKNAVATLTELGAKWDATRVRATLRTYHPNEDPRQVGRPGYGDRLTPREQEVAQLASAGLTNREIGTTLHQSHRTVEQHVRRAMRKLGVHSRAGLRVLGPGPDAPTNAPGA